MDARLVRAEGARAHSSSTTSPAGGNDGSAPPLSSAAIRPQSGWWPTTTTSSPRPASAARSSVGGRAGRQPLVGLRLAVELAVRAPRPSAGPAAAGSSGRPRACPLARETCPECAGPRPGRRRQGPEVVRFAEVQLLRGARGRRATRGNRTRRVGSRRERHPAGARRRTRRCAAGAALPASVASDTTNPIQVENTRKARPPGRHPTGTRRDRGLRLRGQRVRGDSPPPRQHQAGRAVPRRGLPPRVLVRRRRRAPGRLHPRGRVRGREAAPGRAPGADGSCRRAGPSPT